MMNDSQKRSLEMLENVFVQEKLQTTISFTSLFVLIFEVLKDNVINRLLCFYSSSMEFANNEIIYRESQEYKQSVKKLAQKPFHASLRWFVNKGVINDSEFKRLLEAELRRNCFVHELYDVVCSGILDSDVRLLADLITIYKKIDSWWIYNIEVDWDEIEDPDKIKMNECFSCSLAMIDMMVSILLKGEADVYRDCFAQIKDALSKKLSTNVKKM